MNVINLLWYISVVMFLGAAMSSTITVVPALESTITIVIFIFAGNAFLFAIAAFLLQKRPADHWAHTSKPLRNTLLLLAITSTLILIIVG